MPTETYFVLPGIFWTQGIKTFKKNWQNSSRYQVFMYNIVDNYPNLPNIYYSLKELKHFGLEILVIHRLLEYIILDIFKYIFWYFCTKIRIEKNVNYSQRFFNYIKCHKDFNTLKLYTLKALLSKNLFHFFFLSFWHPSIPLFIGIPRYWH